MPLKFLNEEELEKVKNLQDLMNNATSDQEIKKLVTEISLIIEKARVRMMKTNN